MPTVLPSIQHQDNFGQTLLQLSQVLAQGRQQREQLAMQQQAAEADRQWQREQAEREAQRWQMEFDATQRYQDAQLATQRAAANRPAAPTQQWESFGSDGYMLNPYTGEVRQGYTPQTTAGDQLIQSILGANQTQGGGQGVNQLYDEAVTFGRNKPAAQRTRFENDLLAYDDDFRKGQAAPVQPGIKTQGISARTAPQPPRQNRAAPAQAGTQGSSQSSSYGITLPDNITWAQIAALGSLPGDQGEQFRNLLTQQGKLQDLRNEVTYEPELMSFVDKFGGIYPISPEMQNQINSSNLSWNSSLEEYVDPTGKVVPIVWPENYQRNKQEEPENRDTFGNARIVLEDINKAIDQAGFWTTGFVGGNLSGIRGTPAYDFNQTLKTIQASIGFQALQDMRHNSPTGGALGSVTESEHAYLQSLFGNIEQSQSQEQLVHNLERLRNVYLDIVHGPGNWTLGQNGAVSLANQPGGAPAQAQPQQTTGQASRANTFPISQDQTIGNIPGGTPQPNYPAGLRRGVYDSATGRVVYQ